MDRQRTKPSRWAYALAVGPNFVREFFGTAGRGLLAASAGVVAVAIGAQRSSATFEL